MYSCVYTISNRPHHLVVRVERVFVQQRDVRETPVLLMGECLSTDAGGAARPAVTPLAERRRLVAAFSVPPLRGIWITASVRTFQGNLANLQVASDPQSFNLTISATPGAFPHLCSRLCFKKKKKTAHKSSNCLTKSSHANMNPLFYV